MGYTLLKDVIGLIEKFESDPQAKGVPHDLDGFQDWIIERNSKTMPILEPDWEGKANGRSPESVINTFIVHMNRYAKTYSKSAIHNSEFTTQEDFIYLINLKAFGAMSKMELIKRNIQDKSVGMQIINRLIGRGWIAQENSLTDKRSKIIRLTDTGAGVLATHMDKIRDATNIVTGDLTHAEKMELIRLLSKLDRFHNPIFLQNVDSAMLLNKVGEIRKTSSEDSIHLKPK